MKNFKEDDTLVAKLCFGCVNVLSLDNFYIKDNRPDGLDGLCKACRDHLTACRLKTGGVQYD